MNEYRVGVPLFRTVRAKSPERAEQVARSIRSGVRSDAGHPSLTVGEPFVREPEVATDGGEDVSDVYERVDGMNLSDETPASRLQEAAADDTRSPLGGVIPDADMKLAEISLTFVDANGIQRKWSRTATGYDPDDFQSSVTAPEDGEPVPDGGVELPEDADPAALADAGQLEQALEAARREGRREVGAELMNLARHLYHESRTLGGHVKDSERHHGNELASAIYQARADALMDACEELREMSLWADGERSYPPALEHGKSLKANGKKVPRRSGGGN